MKHLAMLDGRYLVAYPTSLLRFFMLAILVRNAFGVYNFYIGMMCFLFYLTQDYAATIIFFRPNKQSPINPQPNSSNNAGSGVEEAVVSIPVLASL